MLVASLLHSLPSFSAQILSAVDLQTPKSFADFKDVYIIFDLMDTDMHHVIYSRQRLSEEHIKYFMYQVRHGDGAHLQTFG